MSFVNNGLSTSLSGSAVESGAGAPVSRRALVAGIAAAAALAGANGLVAHAHAAEAGKVGSSADGAAASGSAAGDGEYDIVVVGMGGAGMCAAIAAKEAGAERIVILEKAAVVGGNTNFSSGGMNAAETRYQKEAGIEDSVESFISDTLEGGHHLNNVDLVTAMCTRSSDAIDWLADHGMELSNVVAAGGASADRCHRPADKSAVGAFLVPRMEQVVADKGIEVRTETGATELLKDDTGKVCGVKATDADGNEVTLRAGAVVLAAGGFGANFDMIKMYRPDLADMVTTNTGTAQGDGMVMAQAAGANLIQMDQIQAHPTVYIVEGSKTGMLVSESVRGSGSILINENGERFVNEMLTRDAVSAAELQQPDGKVWIVYDQGIYDETPLLATYDQRGMSVKGDTVADLAQTLGVDGATLQQTIDDFNAGVADDGASDPFGRTSGLVTPLENGPFYAIPVYPGIHHCMGGVYVDTDSQALTIKGEKIPGLYAAGEVTGGIHGGNRLGGNAVCDIVVNGINAGQHAAASLA
jgi:fumarate reductase flavoprotein subunit